jgi:hypothetical protein
MELNTSDETIDNYKELFFKVNNPILNINFLDIKKQKDNPSQIIKITISGFLESLTLNISNPRYVTNMNAVINLRKLIVNDLNILRLVRRKEIK